MNALPPSTSRSAFKPWGEPPCLGLLFRPHRPIVRLTSGLAEVGKKGHPSTEERINRWALAGKHPLGGEALGTVYVFNDRALKRRVAGKVSGIKRESDRLWEWRKIPHVVRFHGRVYLPDHGSTLLMEMAPPSLENWIRLIGRFPFEEVMIVFQQLLQTYEASSAKGWVHGDIRMANVAYREKKITVLDLGLAHDLSSRYGPNAIQALWDRAPEVILGRRYGASVDLWGIGCIIYAIYFGRRFVRGVGDDIRGQAAALTQIFYKIGFPSASYLQTCSLWTLYGFLVKQEKPPSPLPPLFDEIRIEAKRRKIPEKTAELFAGLLGGVLTYDDKRIDAKTALELCGHISQHAQADGDTSPDR